MPWEAGSAIIYGKFSTININFKHPYIPADDLHTVACLGGSAMFLQICLSSLLHPRLIRSSAYSISMQRRTPVISYAINSDLYLLVCRSTSLSSTNKTNVQYNLLGIAKIMNSNHALPFHNYYAIH